jgi:hypothetical protein
MGPAELSLDYLIFGFVLGCFGWMSCKTNQQKNIGIVSKINILHPAMYYYLTLSNSMGLAETT